MNKGRLVVKPELIILQNRYGVALKPVILLQPHSLVAATQCKHKNMNSCIVSHVFFNLQTMVTQTGIVRGIASSMFSVMGTAMVILVWSGR